MIIELYGLPASGKTTFAKKLEKDKGYKIIKIESKKELLFNNFIFLIRYPIKCFAGFFYIVLNSPNFHLFYYKFMNIFLHHNGKYIKAKRNDNGIIDQGHFMNIISLFEKEKDREKIIRYAKFLPKPDILLILNIPESKRQANIKKRGYLGREVFGKEYVERWSAILNKNNDFFLNSLQELNINYRILQVNEF